MKIKPLLLLTGAVTSLLIMLAAASHAPAAGPEPYRMTEDMAETMAAHGIELNDTSQVRTTAAAYQPPPQ